MTAGRSGMPLTVGTAGHVDHGKTALVGALTGGPERERTGHTERRGSRTLPAP